MFILIAIVAVVAAIVIHFIPGAEEFVKSVVPDKWDRTYEKIIRVAPLIGKRVVKNAAESIAKDVSLTFFRRISSAI